MQSLGNRGGKRSGFGILLRRLRKLLFKKLKKELKYREKKIIRTRRDQTKDANRSLEVKSASETLTLKDSKASLYEAENEAKYREDNVMKKEKKRKR